MFKSGGLAIVNRIAKLHGREFTITTHRDGGLDALLSLPINPQQSET